MAAASITGVFYFLIVFSIAFGMGAVRVLLVAPRIGAAAAVAIEIIIILALSWVVAKGLWRARPYSRREGALIGAIAFALTMASEAALAGIMVGQSPVEWARDMTTRLGLLGLAGQIGFAVIPILAGSDTARRKEGIR
jgi:hypothetical protein